MTPLGSLVVPDEYRIASTSSLSFDDSEKYSPSKNKSPVFILKTGYFCVHL